MRKPVVAIVGRPNVGKSTLFNRLLQKRIAIVDDYEGVTRDRHYGETDWNGISFQVIDTGGYLPEAESEMDVAIKEQVEIAIEEADVVLLLLDVRTGLTNLDLQIGSRLRRSNKPIILVANKVDDERFESDIFELLQLGMGDPVPVSAIQGRGTGDLLDEIVKQLDAQLSSDSDYEEDRIKIAIVGKENVGKSSLVNTLTGAGRVVVTSIPGTTRDSIDTPFNYNSRKYVLIDTAGLKRKTKVKENLLFYSHIRTMKAIQRADVVLYMADVNEKLVRQDLRVLEDILEKRKPIIIALNKWDLIDKDDQTYFKYVHDLKERLGRMNFLPLEFISVHEKKRLYKILDALTDLYNRSRVQIKTSHLNKLLLPVIKQTPPPSKMGKEITIKYISQKPNDPQTFFFFTNHAKLIGESYKRFLENKLREFYNLEGIPIRVIFKNKN